MREKVKDRSMGISPNLELYWKYEDVDRISLKGLELGWGAVRGEAKDPVASKNSGRPWGGG